LPGNGDGTFRPVVTYDSGGDEARSVAIADVNGDGRPDLVVANWCDSTACATSSIGVLLGNGNGTFQTAVDYSWGAPLADSVVVADVNGDGKPDLLVANEFDMSGVSGRVAVLLGNGNGTFQTAVIYESGGYEADSVAVGDVNGDGKPDLLVANQCINSQKCSGEVSVLLGNGDGTFQAPLPYPSGGSEAYSITLADVNGDGRPDLLVANRVVSVLWNATAPNLTKTVVNTSGSPSFVGQPVTFTAAVTATLGVPNGETITFHDGATVIGTATTGNGFAKLNTSTLKVGTHTIEAVYPGDAAFTPSSGTVKQTVEKHPTTTSLSSSLNPSIYGQKVTWTATVTSSGPIAPTGRVTFTWSGHTIGSAILNASGVATLTKSNLNADAFPLMAVYSGDAANVGSTSAILNQVVTQATSTATLTSSPNPSTQGQAVAFTAKIISPTVTPTGPVTFTAGKTVLGTAQLSRGKAILTIASLPLGPTKVTVTYYGDSNIATSSASVIQTVQ
jgi:hypothetical protein